jgi:hypothetical protein
VTGEKKTIGRPINGLTEIMEIDLPGGGAGGSVGSNG